MDMNFEDVLKNYKPKGKLTDEKILKLSAITEQYKTSNEFEREKFRNNIPNNSHLILLSISDSLAEKALNEKRNDLIKTALILHSIENFKYDPRENIIRLSIIWYVIEKLQLNTIDMFNEVSKISSPAAKGYFDEFKNRPKNLKSLKSMGLIENNKNGVISIIPIPSPW